jgi:gluconate kinase
VLSEDGKRMHMTSFKPGKVDIMELASDEKLEELKNSRESFDAPSIPSYYEPQPHRMGRLLWFTGPPGAGKSTSAQLMGRNHGYVYYEGDAFFAFVNPYIDVHTENPSMQSMSQKPLKGINPDVLKIMAKLPEMVEETSKGNSKLVNNLFTSMLPPFTDHVKQQRTRLGGDWAVAWAIFSRAQRERARELLDNDVVFIVLNMTNQCQAQRLHDRHAGTGADMDVMDKMFRLYEPAGEDEGNAFNVTITEDMSREDVVEEVQKIVQGFK